MILKNQKLGKHEIEVLASMGVGDVGIYNHFREEDKVVFVTFHSEVGEIGKTIYLEDKTSDDLPEIPIGLKFTNPKSIDSVINQLNHAKEQLNRMLGLNESDSDTE